MKHTPGPWHEGALNGAGSIFCDGDYRMDNEHGATVLYPIALINYGPDPEEDSANARLIAAAPELLAALEAFIDEANTKNVRQMARAAIAKAKGEQT